MSWIRSFDSRSRASGFGADDGALHAVGDFGSGLRAGATGAGGLVLAFGFGGWTCVDRLLPCFLVWLWTSCFVFSETPRLGHSGHSGGADLCTLLEVGRVACVNP